MLSHYRKDSMLAADVVMQTLKQSMQFGPCCISGSMITADSLGVLRCTRCLVMLALGADKR